MRLLTYLPGTMISKVAVTPQLLYETGRIAAMMDQVLLKVSWCETPSASNVSVQQNPGWKLMQTWKPGTPSLVVFSHV